MLYVGLDIPKSQITVCVLDSTGMVFQRCQVSDVAELMARLKELPPFEVCYPPLRTAIRRRRATGTPVMDGLWSTTSAIRYGLVAPAPVSETDKFISNKATAS